MAVGVVLATGRTFEDLLTGWDVAHFARIASNGYAAADSVAFFPGMPLLMRAGLSIGLPDYATGVLVAAAGSLAAALALARLGGLWASVAWLLAPAVFTAVGYTESPLQRSRSGRGSGRQPDAGGSRAAGGGGVRSGCRGVPGGGAGCAGVDQRRVRALFWLVIPGMVTAGFILPEAA